MVPNAIPTKLPFCLSPRLMHMVKTITEALEYYSSREQEIRSFGGAILKERVNPLVGLDQVVRGLGLSRSYTDFVSQYQVEGVSLGFFDLCPGDNVSVLDSLRELNGQFQNPLLPDNLVNVASFEADVIGIAKASPYHGDGSVYFVDITTAPGARVRPLASTFENFIVLASALDKIVVEETDNPTSAIVELALEVGADDYAESWRHIAGMVA